MSKLKLPNRRFSDECVNISLGKQFSNKTPIRRSASCVSLNCDYCGLSFTRKASEAKRNAKAYCGQACMGADRRREAGKDCVICGKEFLVRLSQKEKISTCGDECSHTLRSMLTSKSNSIGWADGRYNNLRGELSHFSKVSNNEVCIIVNEEGKHKDIALRHGLSRSRVSRIKRSHNPELTGLSG